MPYFQRSSIFVHNSPHTGKAKTMSARLLFCGMVNTAGKAKRAAVGINRLKTEKALAAPCPELQQTRLGIRHFFTGFYGVIQYVGKQGAQIDIVKRKAFCKLDVEKGLQSLFQGQVIFGIQHGVYQAVCAEAPASDGGGL